jgi:hypothetical protein
MHRSVRPSLAVLGLALAAAAGCTHDLRLVVPSTTPGPRYDCSTGDTQHCVPANHDDPSEATQSGTAFVILASQCDGRIQEVLVLDAGSSSPTITVTCAPQENSAKEAME